MISGLRLPVAVAVLFTGRVLEGIATWLSIVLSSTLVGWLLSANYAVVAAPIVNSVHPCTTVYLAKSSIPGAGWGTFAARDYDAGEFIGTPSIGIPFLDFSADQGDTTFIYGGLSEYLWESANIGGFGEALKVDIFLPGPASLVNHHAGLENVLPTGLHHDTSFQRHFNPMAGSFSAYSTMTSSHTNGTLVVIRSIRAGEELFIDRTSQACFAHPAYIHESPSAKDYQLVDEMVQSMARTGYAERLTEAQFHDLLHRLSTEIIPAGYGGGDGVEPSRSAILQQLFPRSLREFERCLKEGSARYRLLTRDLKELEQRGTSCFSTEYPYPLTSFPLNFAMSATIFPWLGSAGHCMDTITCQPSTILHAGHGAFSTRALSQGSIVSLAPLITITNGPSAMGLPLTWMDETPAPVHDDDFPVVRKHNNATKQLLLNYCLGHAESDLLLCPTTQAVLMNHAPHDKIPNVGIRWYTDPDIPEYDQWILQSLQDLTAMDASSPKALQARLVIEYFVLRDIEEGEELFLDYSRAWEDALEEHCQQGQSSASTATSTTDRISASIWKHQQRPILPSIEILPMGLAYFCQVSPNLKIDDEATLLQWEDYYTNSAVDQHQWPPEFLKRYQHNAFASLYPCIVLGEAQDEGYFNVEILVKPLSPYQVGRRFANIPKERIQFVDSLYRSDMHLEWAFRHYVPMPDSIFPLHWRRDYKAANAYRLGRYLDENENLSRLHEDSYERSLREASCGLYIAPSNIPGAGFGVYTGVDVPAAGIAISSLLPVIPSLADADRHQWMGKDYVWSSRLFYASYLEGWPHLETAFISFLFGALANAHAGINNIAHDTGEWDPLLDAATEHGAGAFTDYVKTAFRSVYPIKAGEELFVSYGEDWFRHRPIFIDVPLDESFKRANHVVASIWSFISINRVDDAAFLSEALLRQVRENFVDEIDLRTATVLRDINTIEDLHRIIARSGTAEATVQARSDDWLARNGYCLDHIYVSESSIPNAGRGAFSRRKIPIDSVIIASPALVTTRAVLYPNQTEIPEKTNNFHLLINYHFGHKNSSVLFFPLVTSAFINHGSDDRQPNARFQFSTTDKRSLYFESLRLDDLLEQKYSTMMIDFIATRDIEPDEEILIDYGVDWEMAWSDYVRKWKNPCKKDDTVVEKCIMSSKRVKDMNDDKFNVAYHMWSDSHVSSCHYNQTLIEEYGEIHYIVQEMPSDFGQAIVDQSIQLGYEGIDFYHEGFHLPRFVVESIGHSGVACKILSSSSDSDSFDVVYLMGDTDDLVGAKATWRLREVPSSYVMFFHRPFQSDMMRPGAFRHEIAFPDEKFPSLWKDMEST